MNSEVNSISKTWSRVRRPSGGLLRRLLTGLLRRPPGGRIIRAAAVAVSVVAGFAACTARLDITTTDMEPRLVIYGKISTDMDQHDLQLTTTVGYFSGQNSPGVAGAKVTVSGGGKTYDYYEPVDNGYYISADSFEGRVGVTYTLRVEVDLDGDGVPEVYQARTKVPPAVTLEKVAIRRSPTISKRYEVLMWGEVPYDQGYYLNFNVTRGGGPFNDSLSKFRIMEDRYFGGGYLDGLPCFFLNEDKNTMLTNGDMISVKVDVLESGYGKFLSDAVSELSGSIPLFSGPPANLETNLEQISGSDCGPPLGFFGSMASRTASTWYDDY